MCVLVLHMFFCYNKPVWRNSMWKIGNVEIDNQVVLAPMAGISNSAYRRICKEMGCGLIYAEMVSDKAIFYNNNSACFGYNSIFYI